MINIKKIDLFYNILALRTGVWYKPNHVESKRLNSFLNETCKITGINLDGRKITNHSGRCALIQNCEKMGIPKEDIKLLSRHRSDAGLLSYTLPTDNKKSEIVGQLMNKIHGQLTSGIRIYLIIIIILSFLFPSLLFIYLQDLLNICILLSDYSDKAKTSEILNYQVSHMNENDKQIMRKENDNFKTAKEGKGHYLLTMFCVNLLIFCLFFTIYFSIT